MFKRFIGILLVGIVIKTMDDFLDKDIDKLSDQWNITLILDKGILPYCLLILIFSLYFNFNEAVSIFAASYMIGMFNTYNDILPTKLYGWQEGILVIIITAYMTSIRDILSSLTIIVLIQIIDDLIDYKNDNLIKPINLINKFGKVNTFIISIILGIIAIYYFPIKSLFYFFSALILYILFYLLEYFSGNDQYDY